MTNKIENTTIEGINKNIEMIEGTLIFSEYHAEYYRNTNQNKKVTSSYMMTATRSILIVCF